MAHVATAGGRGVATAGGRLAATVGLSKPAPPPEPRAVHAAAAGGRLATTAGGRTPAVIGSPTATPASIAQLLDVDGYALVVEDHSGERQRFATADGNGPTSLQVTSAVNKAATFDADLPALGGALFEWAHTDVVIGHNGRRLFHGKILPVDTQSRSAVRVSGYGRLFELTIGGMTFEATNTDGCTAINEFWERIAERTDGRVRGYCEAPPTGTRQTVGEEGFEASGSPMEVAQKLHGEFGYSFVLDPADSAGVVASFVPGTQTRSAVWQPIGDPQPKLDPTGYANHVIIRGAKRDDGSGDRYRGEARVSEREAERLMGGYLPPLMPEPDDDLESDDVCQSRAQSKLTEARGKYAITGNRDITPTPVTPGFVYEVPSFNSALPPAAHPATAIPQKVTHTLLNGESKTELDFSEPSGVVAQLQRARNPDLAPGGVQRQQPGLGGDEDRPGEIAEVFAAGWPHTYPGPEEAPYGLGYDADYGSDYQ